MNERIKKLRKALGLTQQELADKLSIKRNTVATYETGKSNPSDAAVILICRTFNVNEPWLRTGEGEMFVQQDREGELTLLVQKLLSGESPDFKKRLIAVLAGLKEEQWLVLEEKLNEIISSRPTPAIALPSAPEPKPEPKPDIAAKLAELERQNKEILRQNQEMAAKIAAMEEEEEMRGLGGGAAGNNAG